MSHLVKASTMNHSAKPLPSNVSLKMITLKLNNWVSLQKGAALLQVSLNTRNSYEVSQEDLDCQVLYMKYVKQFFLNMQTIANVSKYRSCKKAAGACLTLQCDIINAQTTQTVPCQYKSEKNISITKGKLAILT